MQNQSPTDQKEASSSAKESRETKTTASATRIQITKAKKGKQIYLQPNEPPFQLLKTSSKQDHEETSSVSLIPEEVNRKQQNLPNISSSAVSEPPSKSLEEEELNPRSRSLKKEKKSFSSNAGNTSNSRTSRRSTSLSSNNNDSTSSYDGDQEETNTSAVAIKHHYAEEGSEQIVAAILSKQGLDDGEGALGSPVNPRTKEAFERRRITSHHGNGNGNANAVFRRAQSERLVIRNDVAVAASLRSDHHEAAVVPKKKGKTRSLAIDRRTKTAAVKEEERTAINQRCKRRGNEEQVSGSTFLRRAQSDEREQGQGRTMSTSCSGSTVKMGRPHLMRSQSERGTYHAYYGGVAAGRRQSQNWNSAVAVPLSRPSSLICDNPRQSLPQDRYRTSNRSTRSYNISPKNPLFSPVQSLMPDSSITSTSSRYRMNKVHNASEADCIDVFASPRQVRRHMLELEKKQQSPLPPELPLAMPLERQSSYGPHGGRHRTYQMDLVTPATNKKGEETTMYHSERHLQPTSMMHDRSTSWPLPSPSFPPPPTTPPPTPQRTKHDTGGATPNANLPTTSKTKVGYGIPFMPDIMRKKKNSRDGDVDVSSSSPRMSRHLQDSIIRGLSSTTFPPNRRQQSPPSTSPLFLSASASPSSSPSHRRRFTESTSEYGIRQASWPPPSYAFSPPLRRPQLTDFVGSPSSSNRRRELQRGHSYSKAPDLESILTSDEEEEEGEDVNEETNTSSIGRDSSIRQVLLDHDLCVPFTLDEERTPLLSTPTRPGEGKSYGSTTPKGLVPNKRDRRKEFAMMHSEKITEEEDIDPLVSSVQASIARSSFKKHQMMLDSSAATTPGTTKRSSNSSSSHTPNGRRRSSRRLSKMHHNMRRITQDLEAWNYNIDKLEEKAVSQNQTNEGPCCCTTFCSKTRRQDTFWTLFFVVQVLLTIFLGLWSMLNSFYGDHNTTQIPGSMQERNPEEVENEGPVSTTSVFLMLHQLKDIGSITLGCGAFAMLLGGAMLVLIASRDGYHYVVMDRNLIPVSIMLTIFLSFAWGILGVRVLPGSYSPALGFIVCLVCAGYAVVIWPRIQFSSTNLHFALTGIRHASTGLCSVVLGTQLVLVVWSTWCALTVVGIHNEIVIRHRHSLSSSSSSSPEQNFALTAIIMYVVLSFIWTFQFIVHWVQVVVAHVIGQWWEYRDHSVGGLGDDDEVNSLTAPTCNTSTIVDDSVTRGGMPQKNPSANNDEEMGPPLMPCNSHDTSTITATVNAGRHSYVKAALRHACQCATLRPICNGSLWVVWIQMSRHMIEQCHDSTTVKHLSDRDNPFLSSLGSRDGEDENDNDYNDDEENRSGTRYLRKSSSFARNQKRTRRESFRESVTRTSKTASMGCWVCLLELFNCIWPTRRRNDDLNSGNAIRMLPLCWRTIHNSWDPMYNKWGFIFLGLYHQHGHLSWNQASMNAHDLLEIRGWYSNSLANDNLIPNVLRLVSLVIGGCTGCFGLGWVELFVKHSHNHEMTDMHHIAFIIGLIMGTTIASVIMNVVVAGVNTILLCYAGSHPNYQHGTSIGRTMKTEYSNSKHSPGFVVVLDE